MRINLEIKRWHLVAGGVAVAVAAGVVRWFADALNQVLSVYAVLLLTTLGTAAAGLLLTFAGAIVLRVASQARRDLRIYRYEARRDRLVEEAPDDDVKAAVAEVARDIARRY